MRRRIPTGAPTAREVCFVSGLDEFMIYGLGFRVKDIAGLTSSHRCGLRIFRAFTFKSGTNNRRTWKGGPCCGGHEHGDHTESAQIRVSGLIDPQDPTVPNPLGPIPTGDQ